MAAMDITLASGPMVAAKSGMAVEANHQSWGSSSSSGLIRNCSLIGLFHAWLEVTISAAILWLQLDVKVS